MIDVLQDEVGIYTSKGGYRRGEKLISPVVDDDDSRSHFKLILCYFLLNSCPRTKF